MIHRRWHYASAEELEQIEKLSSAEEAALFLPQLVYEVLSGTVRSSRGEEFEVPENHLARILEPDDLAQRWCYSVVRMQVQILDKVVELRPGTLVAVFRRPGSG